MFDFHLRIEEESQLWHFVFFLFTYLIAFISNKKYIDYPNSSIHKWQRFILVYSILVLSIAAFNRGDFFHYADIVQNYRHVLETHLEDFYKSLIVLVRGNYLLWRVVVWGGALLLLATTTARLKLDKHLTFLLLLLLYINIFNYSRTPLAVSVYFLGFSFIIKPIKFPILSYIVGFILIGLTPQFHDSAIVLVICTLFAFIPLNRISIPVILIVAILLMSFGYDTLVNYMNSHQDSEETARQFVSYLDSEITFSEGLASFFNQVLKYGTFYIPFIILTKSIYFSGIKCDRHVRRLYGVTFGLILTATIFALTSNTNVFFYRILYMSFAPLCFLISYCYSHNVLSHKQLRICAYLGVISIGFDTLYSIYLKIL